MFNPESGKMKRMLLGLAGLLIACGVHAQTADALKVLAGRQAMGKVILHP